MLCLNFSQLLLRIDINVSISRQIIKTVTGHIPKDFIKIFYKDRIQIERELRGRKIWLKHESSLYILQQNNDRISVS